jgi:hypothetical protein
VIWYYPQQRSRRTAKPTCAHPLQAVQKLELLFLAQGRRRQYPHERNLQKPRPMHNRYATRANMMGGLVAGMHKSILPSAAGRTGPPTTRRLQQQQATYPPFHRPPSHMSTQGPAPPPAYYTGMPPTGGSYRQRTTMAFPAQAPGQIINFIRQYPPGTGTVPIMPQHIQQASQMMTPYVAPNQQPYRPQHQANQQQQGYFS